jgi:DNA-binding response OmpR family regulator
MSSAPGEDGTVRVLIVEDQSDLAEYIADGLRDQGMADDVAYDGASGLEKATLNRYDVIVLDRDLPKIHGDALCTALTQSASEARILMLTAARSVGDLELDRARRRASRGGRPLSLTHKEMSLLECLLVADGAVMSAEEMLERVWDEHADPFSNVVSVTTSRLRRKLGEPDPIETIPRAREALTNRLDRTVKPHEIR